MATVTIEESELARQKEEARLQAIAAKDAEVKAAIKDAGFDALDKLVEAQKNAARKISEHSEELGTLRKFKTDVEKEKEDAAKAAEKAKQAAGSGGGKVDEPDDEKVIGSITPDERKVLAELYEKNEKVRKAIISGGAKAKADAVRGLREVKPADQNENPFIEKKVEKVATADEIRELIKKSLYVTEKGVIGIGASSTGATNTSDDGKGVIVRGSMDAYRKK